MKSGGRRWRERSPFNTNADSPSDPLRIGGVRPPSQSVCWQIAWLSLSIPLQGTNRARIALYGTPVRERKRNLVNIPQWWAGKGKRLTKGDHIDKVGSGLDALGELAHCGLNNVHDRVVVLLDGIPVGDHQNDRASRPRSTCMSEMSNTPCLRSKVKVGPPRRDTTCPRPVTNDQWLIPHKPDTCQRHNKDGSRREGTWIAARWDRRTGEITNSQKENVGKKAAAKATAIRPTRSLTFGFGDLGNQGQP